MTPLPSKAGCQRGFTLVELLVVIAIVAVLAALAIPAALGVRARAQNAQCLNNVRQLGIHLSTFVADRGCYPLGPFGSTSFNNTQGLWAIDPDTSPRTNTLANDVRRGGLWDCPSSQRPDDQHGGLKFADYGYNGYGVGGTEPGPVGRFGFGLGGQFRGDGSEWYPVKESDIVAPVSTYALGDGLVGNGRNITDGKPIMALRRLNAAETADPKRVDQRHRGKANVGFCDGHVESVSLPVLFSSDTDAALSRWNRDHQPHRDRLTL